ncbi:MAG TPA: sigma factor, partial [Myxococcaceae bacterium]|nr:sigma factor [Myxococcaceae bacterium]
MPIDVEAAYRQYGPMVVRRCRKLLQDEAAAVDAMHDVFVQLIRE